MFCINRTTRTVITAALLAGALGAARAEGLYAGASIGAPAYSSAVNGLGGGGGGQGPGLKVYGGWQFTPNFAVEGGLFSLGRTGDANGSAKAGGVYVDGVASYEFAPQWSVLGSAGLAQAHLRSTLGNDNSLAIKGGLGLQYQMTRQVALRLQYERYHFVNAFDAKPNAGEASLGLKIGF